MNFAPATDQEQTVYTRAYQTGYDYQHGNTLQSPDIFPTDAARHASAVKAGQREGEDAVRALRAGAVQSWTRRLYPELCK